MNVCLLIIDDGRADHLANALRSVRRFLPEFQHAVTVLDSAHKLGFAGVVQEAWRRVRETSAEYIFHLEGDFKLNGPIELERMIAVLERCPHLTQMSLLRQAWNDQEKEAGGIIQVAPDDYIEVSDNGDIWTETRRFLFTTNPSVYSASLCEYEWPSGPHSEGVFSGRLARARPEAQCGIWGGKWDPPRVTHLGEHRSGWGY